MEARTMELLKLEDKQTLSREEAAAYLRHVADELASGNDVRMERDSLRFVAKVPPTLRLKVEFEVEDDETELEIELTW
jgi:amphi-Trp domain-containing protein